jgi:hypothetical protein
MSLEIKGTLTEFLTPQTGETKAGGTWTKQSFLVKTDAEYNNLYCFEVFGEEKVQNLTKYQKVGDTVTVEFNVNCNEYQGKYYTTLSAWKISKTENATEQQPIFETIDPINLENIEQDSDGLPF